MPHNNKKLLATVLVLLTIVATPPVVALDMTPEQRTILDKAEAHINEFTTLQARFVQVADGGGFAEGDLYVSRPGKMRLVYDPPTPVLMVADGTWLIHVDLELDAATYVDLDDTPAALLLRADLSFLDPDINLLNITFGTGTVEISASMRRDSTFGRLTFVFSEKPFELRQWRVLDAQNQEVTVTLYNTRTGLALEPNLFRYERRDPFVDE